MKKLIFVFAALLAAILSGCAEEPFSLERLFPKQNIDGARIVFRMDTWDLEYTLMPEHDVFAGFLDAVYGAPVSQTRPSGYSPELSATHVVTLVADSTLTLYYDQTNNLISIPARRGGDGDQFIRTYHQFTQNLGAMLAVMETTALQEKQALETLAPAGEEGLLHAQIEEEALLAPGQEVPSEHFTYTIEQADIFYGVLTYKDQIQGLENGYVLLAAAWGERPSTGYEMDIASVTENDSYYIVHITSDTPAQGAEVENTPTYPTAAVLLDARRLTSGKPLVFVNESMKVLHIDAIDPDFLANIPQDMPELPKIEDTEGID